MTLDLEQKSSEALISCGFQDIFDAHIGEAMGMLRRQKTVSVY
jgi:hypothetical protein